MIRFALLLVFALWASLLLISWGHAPEATSQIQSSASRAS